MLQFSAVNNGTDADSEYIQFLAISDTNLGQYALLDHTFRKDKVSDVHRHFYALPALILKKGEYVRIYTDNRRQVGTYSANAAGKPVRIHYVSMKSKACIWNNSNKERLELIQYTHVLGHKI